jgi:hypothetical protein
MRLACLIERYHGEEAAKILFNAKAFAVFHETRAKIHGTLIALMPDR